MQALKGLGTGNNQGIILKPNHYLLTGSIRIIIIKKSVCLFLTALEQVLFKIPQNSHA